jgi:hypothetical protein
MKRKRGPAIHVSWRRFLFDIALSLFIQKLKTGTIRKFDRGHSKYLNEISGAST